MQDVLGKAAGVNVDGCGLVGHIVFILSADHYPSFGGFNMLKYPENLGISQRFLHSMIGIARKLVNHLNPIAAFGAHRRWFSDTASDLGGA